MTEQEIKENLCIYDKRNPDCVLSEDDIAERKLKMQKEGASCSCDNCFYGLTPMAEELLKRI